MQNSVLQAEKDCKNEMNIFNFQRKKWLELPWELSTGNMYSSEENGYNVAENYHPREFYTLPGTGYTTYKKEPRVWGSFLNSTMLVFI